MPWSSTRNRDNPYAFDQMFAQIHLSPVGMAWRWRTETALILSLLAALWQLTLMLTIDWAGVALGLAHAVVLAVPHTRRFITRRAWCVLTRHRVQKLCFERRLHTRSGRLPLVLWTRPTKVGERIWLWCRAGIAAEDFEDRTGELRAACYARDARVTRNQRWSQIVTIDIIRRDTLAASSAVTSPLERLAAHYDIDYADPPADQAAEQEPGTWPQAS